MNENQRKAAAELFSSWLDKASVGCLLVGMFQTEHMFGGLIGAVMLFLAALVLKVRATQ